MHNTYFHRLICARTYIINLMFICIFRIPFDLLQPDDFHIEQSDNRRCLTDKTSLSIWNWLPTVYKIATVMLRNSAQTAIHRQSRKCRILVDLVCLPHTAHAVVLYNLILVKDFSWLAEYIQYINYSCSVNSLHLICPSYIKVCRLNGRIHDGIYVTLNCANEWREMNKAHDSNKTMFYLIGKKLKCPLVSIVWNSLPESISYI